MDQSVDQYQQGAYHDLTHGITDLTLGTSGSVVSGIVPVTSTAMATGTSPDLGSGR